MKEARRMGGRVDGWSRAGPAVAPLSAAAVMLPRFPAAATGVVLLPLLCTLTLLLSGCLSLLTFCCRALCTDAGWLAGAVPHTAEMSGQLDEVQPDPNVQHLACVAHPHKCAASWLAELLLPLRAPP